MLLSNRIKRAKIRQAKPRKFYTDPVHNKEGSIVHYTVRWERWHHYRGHSSRKRDVAARSRAFYRWMADHDTSACCGYGVNEGGEIVYPLLWEFKGKQQMLDAIPVGPMEASRS